MRKSVMLGCLVIAGCSGGQAKVDSTLTSDSLIVPGAPAIPTAQAPAVDSPEATSASSGRSSRAPAPSKPVPPTQPPRADSVRGIVSVTGTSFEKHVMIASGGNRRVEITGSLASLIGHVAGAEVSVIGRTAGATLDASGFVVRSVDGQPAIDGTLRTEGSVLYIVTANGTRTRIVAPPPPLLGHDGARVWVTGDPSTGVSSFGFIDPPR